MSTTITPSSSTSTSTTFALSNPWGLCCPKRALPLPQTTVTRFPDAYICISPLARRYVRNFIQYSLLTLVLLILILWIGMEIQEYKVIRAPNTLSFYSGNQVCGLSYPTSVSSYDIFNTNITTTTEQLWTDDDNDDASSSPPAFMTIQTFANVENATFNNNNNNISTSSSSYNDTTTTTIIAHCGDCGQCSNPQDIKIYDDTKNTLLETSIYCAKRALIWGRKTTSKCLQENVGLTINCNECWVENIMCDLKYCIFICFWHAIFSQLVSGVEDTPQALNRCTLCDEKRCGPQFITCAGVNRRRSGILSDIERNEHAEVCRSVQPTEWWKNDVIQDLWKYQQEQQQQETSSSSSSTTSNGTGSSNGSGTDATMATNDNNNDGPQRTRLLR